MSLIVQKFGGSSVRDYAHLLRMARIVKSRVDEGDDVVVVLSAQGDTTDGLLQKAKEISERPSPRELDMLLSAGEQMSAALGAMTLRSIGVEAVSLCAWQIPIETDGTHGNAEIELIDTARIRKELAEGHGTVTAAPTGKCWICGTGNPGMAKGGSGDVLSGMIAALWGQKHLRRDGRADLSELAAWAVWFHGKAGDRCAEQLGEYAMLPGDLVEAIAQVLKESAETP